MCENVLQFNIRQYSALNYDETECGVLCFINVWTTHRTGCQICGMWDLLMWSERLLCMYFSWLKITKTSKNISKIPKKLIKKKKKKISSSLLHNCLIFSHFYARWQKLVDLKVAYHSISTCSCGPWGHFDTEHTQPRMWWACRRNEAQRMHTSKRDF